MCHLEGIIDQKQCLRRLHSYSFCFWLGAVDFCLRGWSSSMMYFECYSRKFKSFGSICIFSFPWVEENDERNLKLWITQTRTICMTVLLCFCWDLMLIIIFRTLQITIGSWVVGEFLLSPRAGQMKHIGKSTHLVSVQWKHFSNSLLGWRLCERVQGKRVQSSNLFNTQIPFLPLETLSLNPSLHFPTLNPIML